MNFSIARQQLHRLIQQPEPFRLAEAALYIAQEEYPELDIQAYLAKLDQMAQVIEQRLPQERYPLRILQVINRYLFEELGFRGNTTDYYHPCNSFLNDVMEQRVGIPITLSLIYLDIAEQVAFPMAGVNFPGHFLIRPLENDMQVFVDPFHQGELLFLEDCRERLSQMYGHPVALQPSFFEAIAPRQFLARMLTNLKHIYFNQGDLARSLSASERILLVDPQRATERRDRGLLYYQLGRWVEAKHDLEEYLGESPLAQDRALIMQVLERMT